MEPFLRITGSIRFGYRGGANQEPREEEEAD